MTFEVVFHIYKKYKLSKVIVTLISLAPFATIKKGALHQSCEITSYPYRQNSQTPEMQIMKK